MKKALGFFVLASIVLCALFFYKNSSLVSFSSKKQAAVASPLWIETRKSTELYHLVLGDSVAKGYGSSQGGYAEMASAELEKQTGKKVVVDNAAVNGLTTDYLLRMLQTEDIQAKLKKADLITISIGGNNLLRLNPNDGVLKNLQALEREKDIYKKDLQEILNLIRKQNPSALIVLAELYNPLELDDSVSSYANMFLEGWNKAVRSSAKTHAPAVVLPMQKLLPSKETDLFFDKIHPNDKGYKIIADSFAQKVLSYEQ